VPGLQGIHIVEFSGEYVPAGQLIQLSKLNEHLEHSNEPSKEYSPSGHLMHLLFSIFK